MNKKIFLTAICAVCVTFAAVAQDDDEHTYTADPATTNKRGIHLLPEYGDFALGFDATPIINTLGFGGSGNAIADGIGGRIFGKYFLDDERALRVSLYLGTSYVANKNAVRNDAEVTNNPLNALATAIDIQHITTAADIELAIGYELRRGHGRVQGFFGGEVDFGFSTGANYKYDWANPMTELNQAPTITTNWNNGSSASRTTRITEVNSGKYFSAGLNGFVGVEYFIAPQVSLGGEFKLGFKMGMKEQSETTEEYWNATSNKLDTQTSRSGRWTAQTMDIGTITRGNIFIMFHF